MFDYSLSTPKYPIITEWSSKRNNPKPGKLIKYPFPFEWNGTDGMQGFSKNNKTVKSPYVNGRRVYY